MRKPGKLPRATFAQDYQLEYGSDTLEIHQDALTSKDKVLIIDDLLATGGTAKAGVDLVEQVGGIVDTFVTIIELEFLKGKDLLKNINIVSLAKY